MIVLAIESSTRSWNAAVLHGDQVLGQSGMNQESPISRNLAPAISQLMRQSNLSVGDLDLVAVTRGPGAFTPLRVGITAAKSLAFALEIPLVAPDSLQLLAIGAALADGWPGDVVYCALIDAQRDECFCASYRFEQPWQPIAVESSRITSYEDLRLRRWEPPVICIGPPQWAPPLREIPSYRSPVDPTSITLGRWAIRLAERGEVQIAMDVLPDYGRPSYADEPRRSSH